MAKTERLFQLMTQLRATSEPQTALSMAQALGVSERTLHRDIATLRGLGLVIDGAPGFGFTLIEDNAVPPQSFEETEIEALVLGLRAVAQQGDPDLAKSAKSALRKLQARLPERQAHRLKHAVLSTHRFDRPAPPGVDTSALRQATWAEVEVNFDYVDGAGRRSQRQVKPLGLIYFDRSSALIAWCHMRADFRGFRLDRMSRLRNTAESFRPQRVPLLWDALAKVSGHMP